MTTLILTPDLIEAYDRWRDARADREWEGHRFDPVAAQLARAEECEAALEVAKQLEIAMGVRS
jgi:hypothetical protein